MREEQTNKPSQKNNKSEKAVVLATNLYGVFGSICWNDLGL